MKTCRAALGAWFVVVTCAAVPLYADQNDVMAQARTLSDAGQRSEAIVLLTGAVAAAPANGDARVLLGTMLSWDGRYDEGRRQLDVVLAASPTNGDALRASINLELWSDHPLRADALARRGLQQRPLDVDYLLQRARALVALKRSADAGDALERLLAIDPRNAEALELRRTLDDSRRVWQARAGASYDGFADQAPWRESQVSLSRTTPIGSITARASRAERFGLADTQFEVEMYPRLRSGTYAYLAGAYSRDGVLYPQYRYAVDLYQSLGAGFEGSAGFRRLGFADGVSMYVGSLGKYYGNWLFAGRLFVTSGRGGATRSMHASVRRYLGGAGTFVGFRYGRGAGREELRTVHDFEVLDSDVAGADAVFVVARRVELTVNGFYSREDRVDRNNQRQYSISTGLALRF